MPNLQRTHRLTVPSSVSSTIAAQSHKRLDSQPTIRDKPATIALHTLAHAGTSLLPADEPLNLDEVDSIVAILAAEFPLLDEPLIRAIVSDHSPEQLYLKTEEIREDLAMLQASVVPDPDASRYAAQADVENRAETSSPVSSALQSGNAADQTEDAGWKPISPASADMNLPGSDRQPYGHRYTIESDQEVSQDIEAELGLPTSDIAESDLENQAEQDVQEESFGPVEFLHEMFEHLSSSDIQKTIRARNIDTGGDLSLAIEDLLSLEMIKELSHKSSQLKLARESVEEQPEKVEENGWRNFFIQPDDAAKATSTQNQPDPLAGDPIPVVETSTSDHESASRESGPRPNDRFHLPLNTQMFSRISQPSGSTPIDSDAESIEDIPGTPKVRKVKPVISSGRYASLASLPRDNHNGFSSGDESAGSTKKRQNKITKAIPLRDFEQRLPDPSVFIPSRQRDRDDARGTLESLATYLAELVAKPSADSSFFLTYFHSPDYPNGYAAIREALTKIGSPLSGLRSEIAMVREIRAGIEQRTHAQTSIEDIRVCVGAAGDVSRSLDLLALLEETKSWGGGKLESLEWNTSRSNANAATTARVAAISRSSDTTSGEIVYGQRSFPPEPVAPRRPKRVKKEEHPQNWRVVQKEKAKKPRSAHRLAEFIPAYAKSAFGPDAMLFDMDECRRRASEERIKREAAVRQAGRHFRSGGVGGARGKQVAAFYAGEARRYEAAARSWELRAAEELVKHQSKSDGNFSIDLHGLTLDEAKSVAMDRTQAWHAAQGFVPVPSKPFQIITGQGKHSINHVGILGPGVANELERAGWHVDRGYNGRGYIVVRGVRG